jgi:type VI secretion system protein VasD
MMRYALVLFMLSVLGFLGGCAKPRIDLAVASQINSNPDHTGRPSPVIVKVYELRSDLAFSQSDFRPLFETPVQVLGADLLAADELVLVPGEARRITYEPVEGTRFLGLLAGFRQAERAKWKVVSPVDFEEVNTVGIEIRDATLILIPAEEVSDWDPLQAVYKFHNPTGQDAAVTDEGVSAEPSASDASESSSGRDGSALGDR